MPEPTYEELKAKLALLEQQIKANKPARKPVELFITPSGLVQVRNILKNGSAHNIEAGVFEVLFNDSSKILAFIKANKSLLNLPTDDSLSLDAKAAARNKLIAEGSTLIRKPRES